MEVKMQTSFIPKKPIVESRPEGSGISLFLLLSIIIFIVSVSLSLGVWLWQKSLAKSIEEAKVALVADKATYEENTIEDLIRLNDRIEESKNLLSKHIAVTPVFIMLEKNTIQNVQFKTMKFSYVDNDNIKMDLSGIAKNYDALSKQSEAFGENHLRDFISQPVVSNFTLNPDGTVSFNFSALVNFKLVSYEKNLLGAEGDSVTPTATTTTPNL